MQTDDKPAVKAFVGENMTADAQKQAADHADGPAAAAPQPQSAPMSKEDEQAAYQRNLGVILGVPVKMQVVLGAAAMPVANLLKLGRGSVIELDHKVGEPVDVMVNDRIVARGEVVVVEEERFGVTLTELVVTDITTEGVKL